MNFISALKTKTPFDSRLTALYLLNLSDYIFTLILLSTGYFMEGNFLLSNNITDFGGFILKCIVPLVLLLFIRWRFRTLPVTKVKAVKYILNGGIVFYTLINAFHLSGFILLTIYC